MKREDYHKHTKLLSQIEGLIKDIKNKHFSDTVIHSKMLIDFLVFKALKHLNASHHLKYGRVTDEEKFGFLLEKQVISEQVYDNCIITKGVRNPTIHGNTYPNSHFALGAFVSTMELFYSIQQHLSLPQLDSVDNLVEEYGIRIPYLFHVTAQRYIPINEIDIITKHLVKFSGPITFLITFIPGITHPNGVPAHGVQLNEKIRVSEDFLQWIQGLDFVQKFEYSGLGHDPDYPNTEQYRNRFYPPKQ